MFGARLTVLVPIEEMDMLLQDGLMRVFLVPVVFCGAVGCIC